MTTSLRGVAAAPGVARARIWRLPERSSEDASSGSGMGLEEAAERAAAELESLQERLRSRGREEESEIFGAQAMMAQDPELLEAAKDARDIAVDGGSGEVFLDPDDDTLVDIERRSAEASALAAADAALHDRPLQTADGHRVMLAANIGQPEDSTRAIDGGAEGVGLFRTEFMFMGRATAPDEATQTGAYAKVLEAFGERPVVIRLIDLGGDKDLPYLPLPHEENPFLGVRALRLADAGHEALLLTQL